MKGLSFSTQLVPKVLDGTKTATRRPIKKQPPAIYDTVRTVGPWAEFENSKPDPQDGTLKKWSTKGRYQPGETVYLKEPHYRAYKGTNNDQIYFPGTSLVVWGNGRRLEGHYECDTTSPPWRKMGAMYLPEWASRQKLLIVSVRAEKLNCWVWRIEFKRVGE